MHTRCRIVMTAVPMWTALIAGSVLAQLPQPRLDAISPSGAQVGQSVVVDLVSGEDLDELTELRFDHPGIQAQRVMRQPDRYFPEVRPDGQRFTITVAKDVPPGRYELRAVGRYGISNSRIFMVGHRPEVLEASDNHDTAKAQVVTLDQVVNARCDERQFDHFAFDAKKGQKLVVQCEAKSLDSRADPMIHLYGPDDRRLGEDHGPAGRDPVICFTAPADGRYRIRVSDFLYGGGPTHGYRLCVTQAPWLYFIDPPMVTAGQTGKGMAYGFNLPGGQPADDLTYKGLPLEKVQVDIPSSADPSAVTNPSILMNPLDVTADLLAFRAQSPHGASNALRVAVVEGALTSEVEPNDAINKAQVITLPVVIAGKFDPVGDVDRYDFDAKKDQQFWVEMISSRLGLPIDPMVVLQRLETDKDGKQVVKDLANDDDASINMDDKKFRYDADDPGQLFKIKEDGRYRLVVRDLYGSAQGGPAYAYALRIGTPKPDFRAVAVAVKNTNRQNNRPRPWTVSLRQGETERVRILLARTGGFEGAVRVIAEGLPEGVQAAPVIMADRMQAAQLSIHATEAAKPWAGTIRLVAEAEVNGQKIRRVVRTAETLWAAVDDNAPAPMRTASSLVLAVMQGDGPLPATLSVKDSAAEYVMARGGKLDIPLHLHVRDPQQSASFQARLDGLQNNDRKGLNFNNVDLSKDKPEASFELRIAHEAPVGAFSFQYAGEVEFSDQERFTEDAKRTEEDKTRIAQVREEVRKEERQASEHRQKSENALNDMRKGLNTAEQEKQKAQAPDQAAAQAKVDQARQAIAEAEKQLAESREAENKAKEESRRAEEIYKTAEREANDARNRSNKTKLKHELVSPAITVRVVPEPITIKLPETLTIQAGQKMAFEAKVDRAFECNEPVRFEIQLPKGVGGLKLVGKPEIAKDQPQGQIELESDANAKASEFEATLRAKVRFGDRDRQIDQSIKIRVEAAPEKPAA